MELNRYETEINHSSYFYYSSWNYASGALIVGIPSAFAAVGMLGVQTLLNFLINSGSGQTVVSMPIMAPLTDVVGVSRQTAVLSLQFGDGFSNVVYPVSGLK